MDPDTGEGQRIRAVEKANEYAVEGLKLIITISSGVLVLSVTFLKDVVQQTSTAMGFIWLLLVCWLLLFLSIYFAIQSIIGAAYALGLMPDKVLYVYSGRADLDLDQVPKPDNLPSPYPGLIARTGMWLKGKQIKPPDYSPEQMKYIRRERIVVYRRKARQRGFWAVTTFVLGVAVLILFGGMTLLYTSILPNSSVEPTAAQPAAVATFTARPTAIPTQRPTATITPTQQISEVIAHHAEQL